MIPGRGTQIPHASWCSQKKGGIEIVLGAWQGPAAPVLSPPPTKEISEDREKRNSDFLLGDFFKFHTHCQLRSRYDIQFCIVSQEAPGPLGAPWVQGKNLYFEFLLDSSSSPAQYLFVFTPFKNDAVTVGPGFQETNSLAGTLPIYMPGTCPDEKESSLRRVCVSVLSDFLGRTEIRVADIKKDQGSKGPVTKCLLLHEVPTGEIVVRLDLQLFDEP